MEHVRPDVINAVKLLLREAAIIVPTHPRATLQYVPTPHPNNYVGEVAIVLASEVEVQRAFENIGLEQQFRGRLPGGGSIEVQEG